MPFERKDGKGRYVMWREEVTLGLFGQMSDIGKLFTIRDVDLVCGTLAAVVILVLFPHVSRPMVVLSRHTNVITVAFTLVCLCHGCPYGLATFVQVTIRVTFLTC